MNREIKFRAWHKENKEMIYFDRFNLCIEYSHLSFSSNQEKYYGICVIDEDDIDLNNPMQYIGIKDVNGKEIYEGDIVNVRGSYNIIVEFIEGSYNPDIILSIGTPRKSLKVIGNIYDNPELLEKENGL